MTATAASCATALIIAAASRTAAHKLHNHDEQHESTGHEQHQREH